METNTRVNFVAEWMQGVVLQIDGLVIYGGLKTKNQRETETRLTCNCAHLRSTFEYDIW